MTDVGLWSGRWVYFLIWSGTRVFPAGGVVFGSVLSTKKIF